MGSQGSPGDRDAEPHPASPRTSLGAIYERFLHEHPAYRDPATLHATLTREQFELLTTKMYARITEDHRLATMAAANGIGIGMGGEKAYKAWKSQDEPTVNEPALRQTGTILRLQALFASQPNRALQGAIRRKVH